MNCGIWLYFGRNEMVWKLWISEGKKNWNGGRFNSGFQCSIKFISFKRKFLWQLLDDLFRPLHLQRLQIISNRNHLIVCRCGTHYTSLPQTNTLINSNIFSILKCIHAEIVCHVEILANALRNECIMHIRITYSFTWKFVKVKNEYFAVQISNSNYIIFLYHFRLSIDRISNVVWNLPPESLQHRHFQLFLDLFGRERSVYANE